MAQSGRRRLLIAGSLLVAKPLWVSARAPGRVYRIGALYGGGPQAINSYRGALVERLATHGFEEKKNLRVDVRSSGFTDPAVARKYVEELLAERPDVLMTWSTFATDIVRRVTSSVPVVFSGVADPVAAGFVKSYARPGGNITGASNRYADMFVKRLEIAIELVPNAKRIAILNTEPRLYPLFKSRLKNVAARAGVELLEIPRVGFWHLMLEKAVRGGASAAVPHYWFAAYSMRAGEQVIAKAHEYRLPVVFVGAKMVEAGGLISYGMPLFDDVRRAADQAARILKGAKPAEIPVDQAVRFELAVNLISAKAIGLTVPQSILLRADQVIE